MASRRQRPGAILGLVLLLFLLTGFAALLYQIIWKRLLGFFSGTDVYSVTIIRSRVHGGTRLPHRRQSQLADRLFNEYMIPLRP
jgi:hypothetical protein